MIISSIIPIWLMLIICIIAIVFILKTNHNKSNLIRKGIIIFLLFIMNLRIMIPSEGTQIATNNLNVLFVVDNTISMLAEDYNGKNRRIDAIKEDCKYIINKLNGAKFSVITFCDKSQLVIPFVKDANMTIEAIETINVPNQYYARGSSLNAALEEMSSQLEVSTQDEDRKTILFFISDGEITNEDKLKSFSSVKKYIDNGAVLGYGTTQGGPMKVKNYDDIEEYIEDYDSNYKTVNAISKLDENNLKKIASDMSIEYIGMERTANIDSKLKEIQNKLVQNGFDSTSKNSYIDIYYIFAIPLLGLLIYEFINYKRKL